MVNVKSKETLQLTGKKMVHPAMEQKSTGSNLKTVVKGYVMQNWGSPFIVAFIMLLLAAAGSLSFGQSVLAEQIAVYAYYSLVAGVILQIVCYLKYKKTDEDG